MPRLGLYSKFLTGIIGQALTYASLYCDSSAEADSQAACA